MSDVDEIKRNLHEIKADIKEINQVIQKIDVTLVKQEASLSEHIRRTELLELKLEPVEKHVTRVDGVVKFMGIVALVLGIILSFMRVISE